MINNSYAFFLLTYVLRRFSVEIFRFYSLPYLPVHLQQLVLKLLSKKRVKTKSSLKIIIYSTVTDLARFLGLSTSNPLRVDTLSASNCIGTTAIIGDSRSSESGI